MPARSPFIVVLIGCFKLVKAALLLAASFGVFELLGKDPSTITRWLGALGVDPKSGYVHTVLGKLGHFSIGELGAIGVGALVYAALFLVEGIGLLRGKRWAETLTIVITLSFVPLEIYELVEHASGMKVAALLVNIAIAAYLIARRLTEDRPGLRAVTERDTRRDIPTSYPADSVATDRRTVTRARRSASTFPHTEPSRS